MKVLAFFREQFYYNPGPHGQDGEPGTRSGQYDSSGVFDMHISLLRAW